MRCRLLLASALVSLVTATPMAHAAGGPVSKVARQSLVQHYYRAILRRDPDAPGEAYWNREAARLSGLGADVSEAYFAMALSFFASPEYVAFHRDDDAFLTDLYATFFNRVPDPAGQAYWKGQIAAGLPREAVLASFIFSPEFSNFTHATFGDTTAWAEVNATIDFYRGLLSRPPDSAGFLYWLQRFRDAQCAGASAVFPEADAISAGILASPEYANRHRTTTQFVMDLYNAFMRRGPDLAGLLFWVGQVDSGAADREAVRRAFLSSPEFGNRVAAVAAEGCDDSLGVLASVVYYSVDYPSAATITYPDDHGTTVSVQAAQGQVIVLFDPATSQMDATTAIEAAGGVVVSRLPRVGYYMASVAPGTEAAFIALLRAISSPLQVRPNVVADVGQAVPLDDSWFRTNRPIPLNVPDGAAVIDVARTRGGHGAHVTGAYQAAGGSVGAFVSADDDNGIITNDRVESAIAASIAGADIFTPQQPILLNLSISGGGRDGNTCNWGAACGDGEGGVAMRQGGFQAFLGLVAGTIAAVPDATRRKVMVTAILGNGATDVTAQLQALRANPRLAQVLDDNMILAQADQAVPVTARRPNGRYSNTATDNAVINYDGILRAGDGSLVDYGTSFAAPRLGAFVQQTLAAVPGLAPAQAKVAVRQSIQANALHIFVLSEAIARANALLHPSCDAFTCYNQCFNAWSSCYAACPNGAGVFACLHACDAVFNACPSSTNLSTCQCS